MIKVTTRTLAGRWNSQTLHFHLICPELVKDRKMLGSVTKFRGDMYLLTPLFQIKIT